MSRPALAPVPLGGAPATAPETACPWQQLHGWWQGSLMHHSGGCQPCMDAQGLAHPEGHRIGFFKQFLCSLRCAFKCIATDSEADTLCRMAGPLRRSTQMHLSYMALQATHHSSAKLSSGLGPEVPSTPLARARSNTLLGRDAGTPHAYDCVERRKGNIVACRQILVNY